MSPVNGQTGKAGIIVAPDDSTRLEKLPYSLADDLLFNIVQDLLIKVHRDEKMARARTAAIRVEKLAADATDVSILDAKPEIRIETDYAVYEDGKVMLKGNPLKTTKDILCPRCHLPRLLNPTDGKGAKPPDPSVIYCKKQPYIDKPGYDIYGQTWVPLGPGRGKKKKDLEKKSDGADSSTPDQRPSNVLSYPSATCSKCKRCILVTRLNNHMGSCIGNSGRNASRAAAQKISNGNGGSQNDPTPPSSQRGTPKPGSRASSPKKRDAAELEEEEDSETAHKRKKIKAPLIPKIKLKTKPAAGKKDTVKGSSSLSMEQKPEDIEEPEPAPAKKLTKPNPKSSPMKKGKAKPPTSSPKKKARKQEADAQSESSGTLSSPPPQ